MKRLEIAADEKFGDLVTIQEVEPNGTKRRFLCRCVCDKMVTVRLDHLRSGHTQTCGSCGIEHEGERMSLCKWAELSGIPESTLRARLKTMGMSEALLR